MLYFVTVSQEDKIETLKRSSRLIHYCAAPLLFHPEWRKLRSSTGPENGTVVAVEPSADEKKEETKARKTSKAQKPTEGEYQRSNDFECGRIALCLTKDKEDELLSKIPALG